MQAITRLIIATIAALVLDFFRLTAIFTSLSSFLILWFGNEREAEDRAFMRKTTYRRVIRGDMGAFSAGVVLPGQENGTRLVRVPFHHLCFNVTADAAKLLRVFLL
jgi:hypothetical protein